MSDDVYFEKENVVANDTKSATTCHVLIKKMHELRDSLVTSVGFSFHYFHVLRFHFSLFVFDL